MKLWKREIQEEYGPVEQWIRADEDGTLKGWEVYENGIKSDEVEVGRTLPLGFHAVDAPEEGE